MHNQSADDNRRARGRRRWRWRDGDTHVCFSSTPAPEAPAAPPPPVGVVAATVKSGNVPIYLRGVGTVIAFNNVLIRSQITGQLVKISFRQGQQVKEGDVLAVIDPRPYQAELDQAIANRDRDQAHLANAKIDLNRYTELAKEQSIATQLADLQKAIVDQIVAMIKPTRRSSKAPGSTSATPISPRRSMA